ncbi:hypothetical protein BOX15_Mlig011566g1 [Macrostomum lignano]|uniref:Uncharacterized protein n=1 Tax=Macrostomum lignano TaxID=282301 RepID=A0A267FKH4_9PLAT|nr:hypothetical protein BOX15_Mlig011566g1 [Macrostomum lignano]
MSCQALPTLLPASLAPGASNLLPPLTLFECTLSNLTLLIDRMPLKDVVTCMRLIGQVYLHAVEAMRPSLDTVCQFYEMHNGPCPTAASAAAAAAAAAAAPTTSSSSADSTVPLPSHHLQLHQLHQQRQSPNLPATTKSATASSVASSPQSRPSIIPIAKRRCRKRPHRQQQQQRPSTDAQHLDDEQLSVEDDSSTVGVDSSLNNCLAVAADELLHIQHPIKIQQQQQPPTSQKKHQRQIQLTVMPRRQLDLSSPSSQPPPPSDVVDAGDAIVGELPAAGAADDSEEDLGSGASTVRCFGSILSMPTVAGEEVVASGGGGGGGSSGSGGSGKSGLPMDPAESRALLRECYKELKGTGPHLFKLNLPFTHALNVEITRKVIRRAIGRLGCCDGDGREASLTDSFLAAMKDIFRRLKDIGSNERARRFTSRMKKLRRRQKAASYLSRTLETQEAAKLEELLQREFVSSEDEDDDRKQVRVRSLAWESCEARQLKQLLDDFYFQRIATPAQREKYQTMTVQRDADYVSSRPPPPGAGDWARRAAAAATAVSAAAASANAAAGSGE